MGVMETGIEKNGIKENRQISSYSTSKRRSEGNPFDPSTALPSSYFPPPPVLINLGKSAMSVSGP